MYCGSGINPTHNIGALASSADEFSDSCNMKAGLLFVIRVFNQGELGIGSNIRNISEVDEFGDPLAV